MLARAGQVLDFGADTVDTLRDGGPRVYLIFRGPDAGVFPFVALRCFAGLRFVCHGRLCERVSLEVNCKTFRRN